MATIFQKNDCTRIFRPEGRAQTKSTAGKVKFCQDSRMKPFVKAALAFLAAPALAVASFAADASSFKPPAGSKVAIVVFEDLECPDCARAYPVVWEAARAHKIPVVLHDFPLPKHPWSFDAAIWARYFDTKSEKLGNDFRGYM